MGTARITCDITSGGVTIAAIIKIISINTPWAFFKYSGFITPSPDNRKITTGSSKAKPKPTKSVRQKETKLFIEIAADTSYNENCVKT